MNQDFDFAKGKKNQNSDLKKFLKDTKAKKLQREEINNQAQNSKIIQSKFRSVRTRVKVTKDLLIEVQKKLNDIKILKLKYPRNIYTKAVNLVSYY